MENPQSNSSRYIQLRLRNYMILRDPSILTFERHRTLITGSSGTGKTTIARALAYLGAVPGTTDRRHSQGNIGQNPSIEIEVEGNRHLLEKYRSLILLGDESFEMAAMTSKESVLPPATTNDERKAVEKETQKNFLAILPHKDCGFKARQNLPVQVMSAGEERCFHAFAFAVRNVLRLDIPVVIDRPYGILDLQQRQRVRDFLRGQPYQQILLGSEQELQEDEGPHYVLRYENGHSRAIRIA